MNGHFKNRPPGRCRLGKRCGHSSRIRWLQRACGRHHRVGWAAGYILPSEGCRARRPSREPVRPSSVALRQSQAQQIDRCSWRRSGPCPTRDTAILRRDNFRQIKEVLRRQRATEADRSIARFGVRPRANPTSPVPKKKS